jgi:hypothetical protein
MLQNDPFLNRSDHRLHSLKLRRQHDQAGAPSFAPNQNSQKRSRRRRPAIAERQYKARTFVQTLIDPATHWTTLVLPEWYGGTRRTLEAAR